MQLIDHNLNSTRKLTVYIFFTLLFVSPVFGATISGRVLRDGTPVEGAYVQILNQKGQELDAWTDSVGSYQIEEVWKGLWTVQISSSDTGVANQIQVNIVQDDQELMLPDQLLEGAPFKGVESVKNIFVNSFHEYNEEEVSFLPLKRREIPRMVSIFTKKHIFDAGIGTLDDLYSSVPGVYPVEAQGNSFFMRGIWGRDNIFVNGMSIGTIPLLSDLFLQPDFFDRVEILAEPGSLVAGQSQRGGMINIVLRDPSISKTFASGSLVSDWNDPIKTVSASISTPLYKGINWSIGSIARVAYGGKSFGSKKHRSSAVLISPSFFAYSKRVQIKSDLIYGVLRGVADPGVSSLLTQSNYKEKFGWSRPVARDDRMHGDLFLGLVDVGVKIVERDKGYLSYRVALNMIQRLFFENFSLSGHRLTDHMNANEFGLIESKFFQPKKGLDVETQLKLFIDTPFLKNDFLVSTKLGFSRKKIFSQIPMSILYQFFMKKDEEVGQKELGFLPKNGNVFLGEGEVDATTTGLLGSFTKIEDSPNEDQSLWGIRFFNQVALWNLKLFVGMRYDLTIPVGTMSNNVPKKKSENLPKFVSHDVVSEAGVVLDLVNNRFGLQHLSTYFDCSSGIHLESQDLPNRKTVFLDGGVRGKFLNGYTFSTSVYRTWDDRNRQKYQSSFGYGQLTTVGGSKVVLSEYWGVEGQFKGRVIPGLFVGGWYNFCLPVQSESGILINDLAGYLPRHSGRLWVLTELPVTMMKGIFTRLSLYGNTSREHTFGLKKTIFPRELKLDIALGYARKLLNVQLELLNIMGTPLWKVSEDAASVHPSLEGLAVRGAVRLSF